MTFSKLGTDTQTGQIIELPKTSRLQGLYIIGIQGTGKSGLIENLIMQDIKQQIGVCVLDPHGELIDHVIARLEPKNEKDVILLDIANYNYPFGLNLFTCSNLTNPLEVQKTVDQVKHIFEKLLGVSQDTPLILEYLYNCTYTLIVNPGYTMADIPMLLQDEQCRKKLVSNVTDIDVLGFWRQHDQKKPNDQNNDISSTLRRVKQFLQPLSRFIVGQSKTTIDLQKIMNEGKILLVKLSAQVDSVSSLIGSLMIALLLNAAYNRPAQRRQFHLYADEFQRFATEDFATLLEEARKFGIGTTIAHQNRSQLDAENKQLETNLKDRSRSVGNLVVFKINSKDADDLAGEFDTSPPPAKPEEAGRLPILVIAEKVVDELKNKGHANNERIMALFNEWVRPLTERKRVVLGRSSLEEKPYDTTLHLINRFLVNAMTGRSVIESSEQKQLLADIIVSVTDEFFNFKPLITIYIPYPGLELTYPTHEDTIQALTTFIMSYSNGKFPQHARDAFKRERVAYHLKRIHIEAHRNWVPSGWPTYEKTAEEKIRFEQRQKQHDDLQIESWKIRRLDSTAHGFCARYEPGYKSPISPPPFQNEIKTLAFTLSRDLQDLQDEGYISGNEPIVTQLRRYIPLFCSLDYLFNMSRSEWERHGGKLLELSKELVKPLEEKLKQKEIEYGKRHYEEGTQRAIQAADPVMMERLREAEKLATSDVIGKDNVSHFVMDMMEFAMLLRADPVRTESGQYEIKYRPGAVRPYQDVKNDIANQLSGLPPFTARVKIGGNAPQNPGKKCLSCGLLNRPGALYCTGCGTQLPAPNEYTIQTLAPGQGIGKTGLQQRLASIQANNIRDGYLRRRDEVEQEIIKRQTACRGSSPAQPQIPQQQPRHARQVPVHENCPNCGTSNLPGSKFCNQCGARL